MYLSNPAWRMSCRTCTEYQFRTDGTCERDPDTGDPLRRGPTQATPCMSCPKPPVWAKRAGHDWRRLRELADDLTDQNRQALDAYYRFKAVGSFPDDPIVRWYAGIIRKAEDEQDRLTAQTQCELLRAFLKVATDGRAPGR